jgi:hypothetical protein
MLQNFDKIYLNGSRPKSQRRYAEFRASTTTFCSARWNSAQAERNRNSDTIAELYDASQIALNIIVPHKGDEAKRRMRELLASYKGNPLIAVLCAYIFEPDAIEFLENGGRLSAVTW